MAAILSLSSLLDSITAVTVVGWLLRITLLATIACMYLSLARRAQPAVRHAVAVGSLIAIALLPVASKLLPAVSVPVLRAPAVATTDVTPRPDGNVVALDVMPVEVAAIPAGAIDAAHEAEAFAPATITPTKPFVSRAWSFLDDSFRSTTNWSRFAVVLWMMVATVLLVRLAVAFARAYQLANRAPLIQNEEVRVEVERACRVLGVTRWIDIAVSREVAIPMVTGVMKPRIILPAAAADWSRQRLSVVLLHEIAHIRRRDAVWMLFAQVVSASLWFHPLVRMISRHVRRDSELACDELVLAAGVRGSDYAEHLVSIAEMSSRRDRLAASTLAFAARSTLEQRVASILTARPRATSPKMIGALVAASLALFVAIAAAQPTASASSECTTEDSQIQVAVAPEPIRNLQNVFKFDEQYSYQYQVSGNNDDDDDSEETGGEWYGRAWDHYKKGRYDKAAKGWETAARYGYNPGLSLFNAGCAWALAEQSGKAIDALEASFDEGFESLDAYASDSDLNSLRDDPRFRKFMDTVMNSDEADQRRRAAERDWTRLESRKNIDSGDWNEVGIELLRAGDYDRAATAFDNEFKVSKNEDEDAIYNKACARALGGKNDEALKLLEQSITIGNVSAEHMEEDPDLMSLHKDKRFDGLVKLARDLELDHNDIAIGKKWESKNWSKAIPRFQEVANTHPKIGRAWFNLGYAQIKAEKPAESTASFQKALDLGFKPSLMMFNLACSNAQAGNIDAAFTWLEKSEAAGAEVWNFARWDEDLDPLRADPRWKAMKKRWKEQEDKHAQHHYDLKDYD